MFIEKRSDSKWSTIDEFKKGLIEIDLSQESIPGGGIPLMSDGKIVFVDDSDAHTLIFGNTGSKKTRLIGMPTLQILAKSGESFIATDPKGELFDRTIGLLKKLEYKIIVLNFREPHLGNSWNPLDLPMKFFKKGEVDKSFELINDLAKNIMSGSMSREPFWENSAASFFAGLTYILIECANDESQVHFYNVNKLRNDFETLRAFYNKLNKNSLPYIALSGIVPISAEKTRDSILSTFDEHMRTFFYQRNLTEMLSYSDFDLSKIGDEKTAVFLIMPDEKTTYHKLVSIFIKQCYESLISKAHISEGRKLKVRTNFLLDEFSNLPKISDFPSMITAARSRNMRITIICQGEHQLVEKYQNDAHTIKGNCGNWIFLTSRELSLLREVSDLCGRRDDGLELISISKLQRLNKERGEALVLNGRKFPFVTTLADIDMYTETDLDSFGIPLRKRSKIKAFDLGLYFKQNKNIINKLFEDPNIIEEKDIESEEALDDNVSEVEENRKKELERIKKWIEDRKRATEESKKNSDDGQEELKTGYKDNDNCDDPESEIQIPQNEQLELKKEALEIETQRKLIEERRSKMEEMISRMRKAAEEEKNKNS